MSGGSHDYAYRKVEDFIADLDCRDSALRRAFKDHLVLVARAMHDIEWVDSCDYVAGDEDDAIRECLGMTKDNAARLKDVNDALVALNAAVARGFQPKGVA